MASLPQLDLRVGRTPVPAVLVGLAALFAAFVIGVAVARSPVLGVAMAGSVVFATIALIDFPLAVAVFAATLFLRATPGIGLASTGISILVLVGWLGAVAGREAPMRVALERARRPALACALFGLWLASSVVWAERSSEVLGDLLSWSQGLLLLVIVATTIDSERRMRAIVGAFVISALLSVLYGAASGDLTVNTNAFETASSDGRFASASDPNELAAGMVAATALLLGLVPGMARGPLRLVALSSVGLLVVAIVATQSRGGLVAAACCVLTAFAVARGRRFAAFALTATIVAVGSFALVSTPGALERVTSTDNGGNGRTALWTVAGRMFADHPINGVGFNNFRTESSAYVRDSGSLVEVRLVVEDPKLVHNTYLQLLAEVGIVGLLLFLAVLVTCTLSALRAARIAERRGASALAALAQGVVVAQAGLYAAMVFLSIGSDLRLWLLLGLGPALLAIARGGSVQPAAMSRRVAR